MATKLILRPFLSPPRSFPKPLTLTLSLLHTQTLPYGPSLHKGHNPAQSNPSIIQPKLQQKEEALVLVQEEEEDHNSFNEDTFTRVFSISALRVPTQHCSALEHRLRGHLLNWPRLPNIARVPNDEIEPEFKPLLNTRPDPNSTDEQFVSLQRRIFGQSEIDGEELSPVLYRDKLARSFNSTGYVNFRNLAKISRPPRRRRRENDGGRERRENEGGRERREKNEGIGRREKGVVVEVVEEEEEGCVEDMRGLLGGEFRGGKWRGSTRLLLLDERYGDRGVEELPEAVKAVLMEGGEQSATSNFELVRCKLTLFYSYWQMNEILEALLPKSVIIPSAFETVGHIAHLNLKDEHLPYKKLIARVVLDKNKPKIQTVVNKIDAIHNDHRTMQLEVLAGNHSLVTTVVENGLRFYVDLATVYWNSRLATERQRLLDCFTRDDVVCDVFSGVGPIAISAAKKVKHVYANDLNPYAVDYLERNCVLNKLERKIEVYNMDGRRFIDAVFASQKTQFITQVVMNLPNDAAEYLDAFRGIFGKKPKDRDITLPKLHVYGFSKAHDPEFDFHERIKIALLEAAVEVETRRVRLVAPGKWMLCASFILPQKVAFANVM